MFSFNSLEYNGRYICRYYLNSVSENCHLESPWKNIFSKMVHMIITYLEISWSSCNTLTLALLVLMPQIAFKDTRASYLRQKKWYSCLLQLYQRLSQKTIVWHLTYHDYATNLLHKRVYFPFWFSKHSLHWQLSRITYSSKIIVKCHLRRAVN